MLRLQGHAPEAFIKLKLKLKMMRKKVLFILPLFVIILTLSIGKTHAQKFIVGAKGGLNFSNIATNSTYYDLRAGYNFGLSFEYKPLESLPISVVLEGHYLTYGANKIEKRLLFDEEEILYDYWFNEYYKNTDVRFITIDIPLLIKYPIPFLDKFSPSIYVGSSFTHIIKADAIREYEIVVDQTSENKYEITERVAETAFSGIVGLGGKIDMSPIVITFDIRYRMGFTDLNNYTGKADFKSHSVHVMFGVAYPFGS